MKRADIDKSTSDYDPVVMIVFNFIITILVLYRLSLKIAYNNAFLPDFSELFNFFNLIITLPISYFFFIKYIKKLENKNAKAIIFFSHLLVYFAIRLIFVNNAIYENEIDFEGYPKFHTSYAFFEVIVILGLDFIIGIIALTKGRKTLNN